jgi:hypothetical protein
MNSRLLMAILRASFFGLVKVTRWREQRTRFSLKGTMKGTMQPAGLEIQRKLLQFNLRILYSNFVSITSCRRNRPLMPLCRAVHERFALEDLIWIAVTIAFFALSIGYVHFCDRVK